MNCLFFSFFQLKLKTLVVVIHYVLLCCQVAADKVIILEIIVIGDANLWANDEIADNPMMPRLTRLTSIADKHI